MQVDLTQKFACDLCGKKFYHQKQLEEHYKVHNPKSLTHDKSSERDDYLPDLSTDVIGGNIVLSSLGSGGGPGSY